MDQLKEHPQIVELLDTLDKNGLMKEKSEVQSLVSYIGGMELRGFCSSEQLSYWLLRDTRLRCACLLIGMQKTSRLLKCRRLDYI